MSRRTLTGRMDDSGQLLRLAHGCTRMGGTGYQTVVDRVSVDIAWNGFDDSEQPRYLLTIWIPGIGHISLQTENRWYPPSHTDPPQQRSKV